MKDGFDLLLQQSLREKAEGLQPPEDMLRNIRREAEQRKKEKEEMKFRIKKLVAIAAALCLVCVTCYAAVEISSYESHSVQDYTRYEDLALVEEEVGFAFKCVEAFSNGFEFEVGGINVLTPLDENGNPVKEEVKGVNIGYINAENKRIALMVRPKGFYEDGKDVTEIRYSSDTYKFVPPDYQLTDEDQRMMEEGGFFVSYGSDKVEINKAENYRWEDGGLVYSLLAFDCDLGEEGLAAMAGEIMG